MRTSNWVIKQNQDNVLDDFTLSVSSGLLSMDGSASVLLKSEEWWINSVGGLAPVCNSSAQHLPPVFHMVISNYHFTIHPIPSLSPDRHHSSITGLGGGVTWLLLNNATKHMDCILYYHGLSLYSVIVPFTTSKIARQVEPQYSKFYTQSTVTMRVIRCLAERGALSGA